MSYTEIFSFDKDGNANFAGEVSNAWRGAMAVWNIMQKRYIPRKEGMRSIMQDVWDLAGNPQIPEHERIVLFTTFDHCLVKRDNAQKVIDAFRKFEGDTSLPEQADIIEELIRNDNCIAIGWNQTSVNTTTWGNAGGYDEEKDISIPYNCLTGDAHFWLFEDNDE